MLYQTGKHCYQIPKRRSITYETFTRRNQLARLEDSLDSARIALQSLSGIQRRRQREKIARLECQTDTLRLKIQSEI